MLWTRGWFSKSQDFTFHSSYLLIDDEDLKRKVTKSEETMAKVCHSLWLFYGSIRLFYCFPSCVLSSTLSFHSLSGQRSNKTVSFHTIDLKIEWISLHFLFPLFSCWNRLVLSSSLPFVQLVQDGCLYWCERGFQCASLLLSTIGEWQKTKVGMFFKQVPTFNGPFSLIFHGQAAISKSFFSVLNCVKRSRFRAVLKWRHPHRGRGICRKVTLLH